MSREAPVNKEKQALQETVPKAREARQREKSLLPLHGGAGGSGADSSQEQILMCVSKGDSEFQQEKMRQ